MQSYEDVLELFNTQGYLPPNNSRIQELVTEHFYPFYLDNIDVFNCVLTEDNYYNEDIIKKLQKLGFELESSETGFTLYSHPTRKILVSLSADLDCPHGILFRNKTNHNLIITATSYYGIKDVVCEFLVSDLLERGIISLHNATGLAHIAFNDKGNLTAYSYILQDDTHTYEEWLQDKEVQQNLRILKNGEITNINL